MAPSEDQRRLLKASKEYLGFLLPQDRRRRCFRPPPALSLRLFLTPDKQFSIPDTSAGPRKSPPPPPAPTSASTLSRARLYNRRASFMTPAPFLQCALLSNGLKLPFLCIKKRSRGLGEEAALAYFHTVSISSGCDLNGTDETINQGRAGCSLPTSRIFTAGGSLSGKQHVSLKSRPNCDAALIYDLFARGGAGGPFIPRGFRGGGTYR